MAYLRITILIVFITSIFNANASNTNPWEISASGFYLNSRTFMEARSPLTQEPLRISFEDDLNLTNKVLLPFYELSYEINAKHSVYLDWKRFKRSATNELTKKTFEFSFDEDNNYLVSINTKLDTSLKVDIFRSGYQYKIFTSEDIQVAFIVGLHVMKLDLMFGGEIQACLERSCTDEIISEDKIVLTEVTAPLPNLGFSFDYRVSERLFLVSKALYFSLQHGHVQGRLFDTSVGAKYILSNNFSMKLAYEFYDFEVYYQKETKNLNVDFRFRGPTFGLSYKF